MEHSHLSRRRRLGSRAPKHRRRARSHLPTRGRYAPSLGSATKLRRCQVFRRASRTFVGHAILSADQPDGRRRKRRSRRLQPQALYRRASGGDWLRRTELVRRSRAMGLRLRVSFGWGWKCSRIGRRPYGRRRRYGRSLVHSLCRSLSGRIGFPFPLRVQISFPKHRRTRRTQSIARLPLRVAHRRNLRDYAYRRRTS